MILNLTKKRIIFFFGAVVVLVLSFLNIGYFVFMVIGGFGSYFVIPFINNYFKNRKVNNIQKEIDKHQNIIDRLKEKQKNES
jgi:uncharacterized membrane protein (DUF373 family)